MDSLKVALREWTDADVALYEIGCALGLFPKGDPLGFPVKYKFHCCSRTDLGDMLGDILDSMIEQKILLWNENEIQVKWNEEYITPIAIPYWKNI